MLPVLGQMYVFNLDDASRAHGERKAGQRQQSVAGRRTGNEGTREPSYNGPQQEWQQEGLKKRHTSSPSKFF